MEKNKLPEYVIEELIPRFSGIDSTILASIRADKYNDLTNACESDRIDGHYILAKESRYDADDLFLTYNSYKHNTYAIITLLTKQEFDCEKKFEKHRMYCDETENLLWGYYVNPRRIYVTPKGFVDYFKIKTLESEIGVEYKKHYRFDEKKLNINRGYEIRNNIVPGIITYAILNRINRESLEFTTIEQGGGLDKYELPIEHVVNGTIEIEPVDL